MYKDSIDLYTFLFSYSDISSVCLKTSFDISINSDTYNISTKKQSCIVSIGFLLIEFIFLTISASEK